MSHFYGSASRFADWPRRQYPPAVKPLFDASKPLRFCLYGDHLTTNDAPDPAGKGCTEHRSVKWRSKYKPGGNRGAVITERWCKTCISFRPRDQFALMPAKRGDVSTECNDCVSRRVPVVTVATMRFCRGCDESYPKSDFVSYIGANGRKTYAHRCSACFQGPRKIFGPDPERDARIIQQVTEGKPQRLIAVLNEVSRGYVARVVAAHRVVA